MLSDWLSCKLKSLILPIQQTYSGAASLSRGSPHKSKGQALSELKDVLKHVVAYAEPDPSVVCGTCYAISCEEVAGLTWKPVPKLMASQELGFLSIPAVDELEAALFKQVWYALFIVAISLTVEIKLVELYTSNGH